MNSDQRKDAAGIPSGSTVTEVMIYPQYGNSSTYKAAARFSALFSAEMSSLIKPVTLLIGAACGCHATKGSI